MRKQIAFWVDGTPITQGSKNAFIVGKGRNARAVVVDVKSEALKAWRDAIVARAEKVMARESWATIPAGEPCQVAVQLWLPRPKSHYRTGRNAHLLKDTAPAYPTNKNDIDKHLRAVYDALTNAKIYEDDGQVVGGGQSKSYCTPTMQPGVHVTVYSLEGMTQNL